MSCNCNNACIGTPEQNKAFDAYLSGLKGEENAKKALQKAQEIFGYVPFEVQHKIAEHLNVSLEKVYGVSTFYSQFSLEPKGKNVIRVCNGTACNVKGADAVIAQMEKTLKVKAGQTTPDLKFTLEVSRCLGCCALAPVFTVNGDDVYGEAKPEQIEAILAKYK